MVETKIRMVEMAKIQNICIKLISSALCENDPAVFKHATPYCPQFLISVFRSVGEKTGKRFEVFHMPLDRVPPSGADDGLFIPQEH